jgi:hypothetical protein
VQTVFFPSACLCLAAGCLAPAAGTGSAAGARDLPEDDPKPIRILHGLHDTDSASGSGAAQSGRLSRLDIYLGGAAPTKYNVHVHYHGTGARKPILLLAHTDVIEAKREGWNVDPLRLLEKDGYLYGRGISDDKGRYLREAGIPTCGIQGFFYGSRRCASAWPR